MARPWRKTSPSLRTVYDRAFSVGNRALTSFGAVAPGNPMRMSPPPLVRRFPARADQIGPVRRDATAYARAHGVVDAAAVALALSEAITNSVLHAYVDAAAPGEVEVVAQRLAGDGLQISVCDDGRGMTPRADSPGMGLGLPLVASLTERFEIQARPGGGTRVCMYFAAVT